MNNYLTEEQMRAALFGSSASTPEESDIPVAHTLPDATPKAQTPTRAKPIDSPKSATAPKRKSLSPKIRVTLHVTRLFEGDLDVITHESSSLSTLIAQQEAKAAAKKKGYKYVEIYTVEQV